LKKVAVSSYAANGEVFIDDPRLNVTFSDGLSNTIVFAEHYAWNCYGAFFPYWQNHAGQVGRRPAFADIIDVIPISQGNPAVTMPSARPPSPVPTFQVAPSMRNCYPYVAQTPHSSGMLVAMADGAVRQLAPNISTSVFWGAVTPNKGELPGLD
jgi:hypothetical protein